MTQILIAGVEVVLPQNFSCTVKRENSFFTKKGEYTYDVTLRLDNPTNRSLYGFLQRVNKTDQLATQRSAVMISEGRVYARGTEIISRWTNENVTIQIVSGESELNYFMGQDQKIEDLDLGVVTTDDWITIGKKIMAHQVGYADQGDLYCAPPIKLKDDFHPYNWEINNSGDEDFIILQPFMKPLIEKLFRALGYTTVNLNCRITQCSKQLLYS